LSSWNEIFCGNKIVTKCLLPFDDNVLFNGNVFHFIGLAVVLGNKRARYTNIIKLLVALGSGTNVFLHDSLF
jgi:uncharacterized membrane protein